MRRFLLLFPLMAAPAIASEIPETSTSTLALWELGVLGGLAYVPDYPASDENRLKWVAAPYFVYRGDILRADREGARASLFRHPLFDVEMSFAAAFASNSEDNEARRGMPDLDYMLETGPRLSVTLSSLGGWGKLKFFLPVRAVFTTDFTDFRHRGWTLTPALYGRIRPLRRSEVLLMSQLAANFGNRQLLAYFYDVPPAHATASRPFYDAQAGYIGTDLFVGGLIPVKRAFRVFGGLQLSVHDGAANERSPLFRRPRTLAAIVGMSWLFKESKRRAPASEEVF